MRIPDADADPEPATKFILLVQSSILCEKKLTFLNILLLFKESVYFEGQSSENLDPFFNIYG